MRAALELIGRSEMDCQARRGSEIWMGSGWAAAVAVVLLCCPGWGSLGCGSDQFVALSVSERWASESVPRTIEPAERERLERDIGEIRAFLAESRPTTSLEGMQKGGALERLAGALRSLERYEEELDVRLQLIEGQSPSAPLGRHHRRMYGEAALYLGREDEALQAFIDAGSYNSARTFFYAGLLLEERGSAKGALEAYRRASQHDGTYADPVLRRALLVFEPGGDASQAIDLLVKHSPRVGRYHLMRGLKGDPEFAALRKALEQSGRAEEIEERRIAPPEPGEPPPQTDEEPSVYSFRIDQPDEFPTPEPRDWPPELAAPDDGVRKLEPVSERVEPDREEGRRYRPLHSPHTDRLPADPSVHGPLPSQPDRG
jgi:hypothetical protein